MISRLIIPVILLLIPDICYSQGILLKLNLSKGYQFETETMVNLMVEQEFMGIRYNTMMDINTEQKFRVDYYDVDSNIVFISSYIRTKISVSSLLVNMEVNSESGNSSDSLSSVLSSICGKDFRIVMNRKGEIIRILGLNEIIENTVTESNLKVDQKEEFARNLVQSLGEEALMENYNTNRVFYPDFPVESGDSWQLNQTFVRSGIPMDLNAWIHFRGFNKGVATLKSEGSITSRNFKESSGKSMNPGNPYRISGNEISDKKIDIKTGLILESIVSQNISGSIITKSPDDLQQDITVPFRLISRCSIQTQPDQTVNGFND